MNFTIIDKNNNKISPLINESGLIINIKKGYKLSFNCEQCGKFVKKSIVSFRDNGYPYSDGFDFKNATFLCRECNIKNTTKKKYGVDNVSKLENIKNKKKNTMITNYGSNYQNIINGRETILEKYGVENVSQIDFVRDIKSKQKREKYKKILDINNLIILDDFTVTRTKYENIYYTFKCKNCGNIFKDNLHSRIPRCTICYPSNISSFHKEIEDFLKNNIEVPILSNNWSILKNKELDIYIPNYNIAIECNGLYWHSELNGKDRNYHLNKTKLCEEQGIQLIHIFEDEWVYKKEIVKSILLSKLNSTSNKIYARKCKIKIIDCKTANDFYEQNHIQGSINSSINLGLFHEEELIACMSFLKNEISRFANKLNTSVIGGFSKLFKYFTNNYNFDNIITYADRRYFIGKVYEKNGFEFVGQTQPDYFYLSKDHLQRFNRIKFQKHKLYNLLEHFDPNLTEWENMQINGYDRIWGVGHYKYVYRFNQKM